MARKARGRRQRVSLRFKRREELKQRIRVVGVRSVALALIVGFGVGIVAGQDSVASRFLRQHTPSINLDVPPALAGQPVQAEMPKNPIWLWVPGSEIWLDRLVRRKHAAVKALRLERHFEANRLTIHLEARQPLVVWNGAGLDQEGVLFSIAPGSGNALPQAAFLASANRPSLGGWLSRLASVTDLWPQIASVHEDAYETMELTLKTGTVVIWGAAESEMVVRKSQMLLRALGDAHNNLGGASRADLRFFEQGRIIVLPKGK